MIKLSKIYKSYDKRVVLSDVTLSVSNNEYVCITGESGAGKTTLLNLIGLLDKPDCGEVSINDNAPKNARSKTIGYSRKICDAFPNVSLNFFSIWR